MKRRRKRGLDATAVTTPAKTSIESAGHGHCTRAFEALSSAQSGYGAFRGKAPAEARAALAEARQTFFRRCVVPQR